MQDCDIKYNDNTILYHQTGCDADSESDTDESKTIFKDFKFSCKRFDETSSNPVREVVSFHNKMRIKNKVKFINILRIFKVSMCIINQRQRVDYTKHIRRIKDIRDEVTIQTLQKSRNKNISQQLIHARVQITRDTFVNVFDEIDVNDEMNTVSDVDDGIECLRNVHEAAITYGRQDYSYLSDQEVEYDGDSDSSLSDPDIKYDRDSDSSLSDPCEEFHRGSDSSLSDPDVEYDCLRHAAIETSRSSGKDAGSSNHMDVIYYDEIGPSYISDSPKDANISIDVNDKLYGRVGDIKLVESSEHSLVIQHSYVSDTSQEDDIHSVGVCNDACKDRYHGEGDVNVAESIDLVNEATRNENRNVRHEIGDGDGLNVRENAGIAGQKKSRVKSRVKNFIKANRVNAKTSVRRTTTIDKKVWK